jgi:hypothetical protein
MLICGQLRAHIRAGTIRKLCVKRRVICPFRCPQVSQEDSMTLLAFLLLCGCVAGALGYLYQRERNAGT